MKKIMMALCAVATMAIAGCGGGCCDDKSEVEKAIKTNFEKMQAGELTEEYLKSAWTEDLYNKDFGDAPEEQRKMALGMMNAFGKQMFAGATLTISEITIDGDTATAKTTIAPKDDPSKAITDSGTLKKVNGVWKLDK